VGIFSSSAKTYARAESVVKTADRRQPWWTVPVALASPPGRTRERPNRVSRRPNRGQRNRRGLLAEQVPPSSLVYSRFLDFATTSQGGLSANCNRRVRDGFLQIGGKSDAVRTPRTQCAAHRHSALMLSGVIHFKSIGGSRFSVHWKIALRKGKDTWLFGCGEPSIAPCS
jgi:hypothetical protein